VGDKRTEGCIKRAGMDGEEVTTEKEGRERWKKEGK